MTPWKLISLISLIKQWPVASQQAARRNALVASTALTRVRVERGEIEAFVDAAIARHEVRAIRADRLSQARLA